MRENEISETPSQLSAYLEKILSMFKKEWNKNLLKIDFEFIVSFGENKSNLGKWFKALTAIILNEGSLDQFLSVFVSREVVIWQVEPTFNAYKYLYVLAFLQLRQTESLNIKEIFSYIVYQLQNLKCQIKNKGQNHGVNFLNHQDYLVMKLEMFSEFAEARTYIKGLHDSAIEQFNQIMPRLKGKFGENSSVFQPLLVMSYPSLVFSREYLADSKSIKGKLTKYSVGSTLLAISADQRLQLYTKNTDGEITSRLVEIKDNKDSQEIKDGKAIIAQIDQFDGLKCFVTPSKREADQGRFIYLHQEDLYRYGLASGLWAKKWSSSLSIFSDQMKGFAESIWYDSNSCRWGITAKDPTDYLHNSMNIYLLIIGEDKHQAFKEFLDEEKCNYTFSPYKVESHMKFHFDTVDPQWLVNLGNSFKEKFDNTNPLLEIVSKGKLEEYESRPNKKYVVFPSALVFKDACQALDSLGHGSQYRRAGQDNTIELYPQLYDLIFVPQALPAPPAKPSIAALITRRGIHASSSDNKPSVASQRFLTNFSK